MTIALTGGGNGAWTWAVVTGLNNQSSAAFVLEPGVYSFIAAGTFSSTNIGLQQLGPDGSTYVDSFTRLTANGVQAPLYLPAGTYKFAGTSTSCAAAVQKVMNS